MNSELCDLTVLELKTFLQAGPVSPVDVMQQVLTRITRFDPVVNGFCQMGEYVLEIGRAYEQRSQRRSPLGPLDGVPVSIKDNVAVAGMATRFGSLTTPMRAARSDSPCVARLREAGAICFGKTTLPDFAHKIVTDSPLTGVTRNPWRLDCTPGGSSGGAAVALALGMAAPANGTRGGGSLPIPASFTGTFRFKPQFGC